METKNILGGIVSLTVAVIFVATIMMPVLSDAMETAGTAVTYTNSQGDYNTYMREIQDGDVITIILPDGDTVTQTSWQLNGETLTTIYDSISLSNHSLIFSDVFNYYTLYSTQAGRYTYAGLSTEKTLPTDSGNITITYNSGTFTVEYGTTTESIPGATWGYIACNEDEAEYYESTRTGSTEFYVSDVNDVVCSGVYTTGELDTFYWYYQGESGGNDGYTVTTTLDFSLVDGTTNVYTTSPVVTVTDGTNTESFTPYRIMIPLEVEGNATHGGTYELYGVIPVIVIVGIVVASLGMITTRRD